VKADYPHILEIAKSASGKYYDYKTCLVGIGPLYTICDNPVNFSKVHNFGKASKRL
jgi:hypothetical protein